MPSKAYENCRVGTFMVKASWTMAGRRCRRLPAPMPLEQLEARGSHVSRLGVPCGIPCEAIARHAKTQDGQTRAQADLNFFGYQEPP